MMTKKDYELIANTIYDFVWEHYLENKDIDLGDMKVSASHIEDIMNIFTRRLAEKLKEDNPKFNDTIFLEYCGVKR